MAKLPAVLSLNGEAHEQLPLTIASEVVSVTEGGSGYKQPWQKDDAEKSVKSTGMFEASGCAAWLQPFSTSEIPCEEPSLETVVQISELFSKDAVWAASIGSSGAQAAQSDRLVWPGGPMVTYVKSASDAVKDCFRQSLPLVHGHAVLWAWYMATMNAIVANDKPHLQQLWQVARTMTIQVGLPELNHDACYY